MAEHPRTDATVLQLVHPIPGFPDDLDYRLTSIDGGDLARLESTTTYGVRFLVVPAAAFFPTYAPEIDDDTALALGLDDDSEVLVLLIVHAAATLAETTVNLRAPLLVDVTTRRAAQVILEDASLPLAAPLLG